MGSLSEDLSASFIDSFDTNNTLPNFAVKAPQQSLTAEPAITPANKQVESRDVRESTSSFFADSPAKRASFDSARISSQIQEALSETKKSSLAVKPSGSGTCSSGAPAVKNMYLAELVKAKSNDPYLVHCLRDNMREELLRRLVKSKMGGNVTSANPQVQETFARRMEEFLYKSSKSVEQYADIKTIDKRLQALMSRMHQRRNTTATTKVGVASGAPPPAAAAGIKQRKRTDTPQEQRKREVLVKILGQAKMIQVFNIVAEIKLIQLGRDVTEGKPFKPIRKCTSSGCSFMVPMAGSQKVPQVVRDLFFNTAIVPALERTSPDHYASLPWDQLIAQGERRLKSYHEWYQRRRQGAS